MQHSLESHTWQSCLLTDPLTGAQVGKRKTTVTILAGSVVRVWGALEAVLSRHEHSLSKSDRTMRAVHVTFPDGSSLIGEPSIHSPSAMRRPACCWCSLLSHVCAKPETAACADCIQLHLGVSLKSACWLIHCSTPVTDRYTAVQERHRLCHVV